MTKLGAACLHSKIRLGSGHLGLIRVAVHGYKVGGHAVKVYVFSLGGAALQAWFDLTDVCELAGQAGIIGGLSYTGHGVRLD